MRILMTAFVLVMLGSSPALAVQIKNLEIEQTFPEADVTGLSVLGTEKVSPFNGKPVVVVYWASWCPHCRKQTDYLGQLYKKYGSQGFRVLGIAGDKDKDKAAKYAQAHIPFPSVHDEGQQLFRKWGVGGIPVTLMVDKRGKISELIEGENTEPGNPFAAAAALSSKGE
jgi:thiol-disulfide isomerase/thioredoxin